MPRPRSFLLIFIAVVASCSASKKNIHGKDDGKLQVVFVQVNDVYEIAPLENGKTGGMARVATLKKQYLASNPNTLLVMAGDFVSPSLYNSLQYEGKAIRGKQMVAAMNAAGMNLATFGNHEFDIKESELQERINESAFQWVSSNTFHKQQDQVVPFEKVTSTGSYPIPRSYILSLKDADGTTARVGFIGLTLPVNKASFVSYTDPLTAAKEIYSRIKDSCDAVVAITHEAVADDIKLAEELPGLAVILGGHEHDMQFKKVGKVYITKAHSNARSAYIVTLDINKKNKTVDVHPQLKHIDESIKPDSATDIVVKKWMEIGDKNYDALGFDPKKIVITTGEVLEGRETEIRSRSTNLTRFITAAMADACPEADVVIFNSGSIRVDDRLAMPVTEYDILRSLPFGGSIREVDMKGKLVTKILSAGVLNKGSGGFLQYQPVVYDSLTNGWNLGGHPIDPEKIYRVALSEFLLTGMESNLDFLNKDNPDITKVYDAVTDTNDPKSDIRLAIVRFLEHKK